MIGRASRGLEMRAHSVMEELIFYLCNEETNVIFELSGGIKGLKDDKSVSYRDWVFDLFDDIDIITYLYSDSYIDSDNPYHFDHWSVLQFYQDQ